MMVRYTVPDASRFTRSPGRLSRRQACNFPLDFPLECRLEVVLIREFELLLVDARLDLPLVAVDNLDLLLFAVVKCECPLLLEDLLDFPLFPEPLR